MQPRRPQVQRAPPIFTTMCPISPAAPRPVHALPSRISPLPTPVPQNTPSSELYSRPAPSLNSASVATWTSLPTLTSQPSARSSVAASGKAPSQSGEIAGARDGPPASIVPGEPTPTPASAAGSTSAALAASRSAASISTATSAGPPLVGVGPAGRAEHAVVLVDDRRLDLGAAEIYAAVGRHAGGSSQTAPRQVRC